ncbi:MAG: hypothetical protein P1Q69_14605 [Candidatus Thorarchaeota archaeon]|nr:hypothetical protein [Candidatus Thorarchaeota archaeon]
MKHKSRTLIIFALVFLTLTSLPLRSEGTLLQNEGVIFDPVTIITRLDANGTSTIDFKALAWNNGTTPLSTIEIRVDSVQVLLGSATVNETSTQVTLETLERYSIVSVELSDPLQSGDGLWIEIQFSVTDLQSDAVVPLGQGISLSDFIFYVRPLSTYSNFSLTVLLPPLSALSQQSVTPIFPQSSANYTDGLSMAFLWQVDTLHPGQEKVFIVRYQTSIEESSPSTLSSIQLVIIALTFLGIGLVVGYAGPKFIVRLGEISRVRIVGITSEEEEVLDAIRLKGGSCPQKDLYQDLDMSQAKVSLILTALEERGLVRRFKDGRENTVHIIEE